MAQTDYEDEDDDAYDDDSTDTPVWRQRLLTWGLAAVALGLGFLIPYTLYLNHQVTQRFGELRWQVPTRVYARPLAVAPGVAMDAQTLKTELDAASYRDDGKGQLPGTYAREGAATPSPTVVTPTLTGWWRRVACRSPCRAVASSRYATWHANRI